MSDARSADNADAGWRVWLAMGLAVVLFLASNAIVGVAGRTARLDLTQDRLYTLSLATRTLLAGVEEPVTLQLYRSRALMEEAPQLKIYADRVDGLLRAYQQASNGKVVATSIEPLAFSPQEDRAIAYRLRGFPVDRAGTQGYFGLVGTNALDGLERIEFLDPAREETLEYDLTSLVKRLAQAKKPVLGVFDTLQMTGSEAMRRPPWAILGMIAQFYNVKPLKAGDFGLDGVDVLLLANPRGLEPQDIYAIDQFALAGKPVLAFVDPLVETLVAQSQQRVKLEDVSSRLDPLLGAWGVDMPDGKVVGDREMALRVTAMAGRQRVVASYLPWLQVREANFNTSDMATSRLRLMRISSAGALQAKPGATTKFTPLIFSTPEAMLLDAALLLDRPNPNVLLDKFVAGGAPLTLAARVTGEAVSAFPEGAPGPAAGAATTAAGARLHLAKSAQPLHVAVVADVDVLADDHVVNERGQLISGNADFVLNLLDTLAGGAELAGLRGRGTALRGFTRVEAMEKSAEDLYHAREAALSADLESSQSDLQQMLTRSADAPDASALTREQQDGLNNLNQKIVELRRQLRDVRAAGRAQIDRLDTRLQFFNILMVPLALCCAGAFIAWRRRRRLTQYVAQRRRQRAAS